MKWLRDLKNKTWIEWLKIVVAIDIASVGIGLIIDLNLHVFANILSIIHLGFLSRLIMGIMYIFVAVLILKRIFPGPIYADNDDYEHDVKSENIEEKDREVKENLKEGRRLVRKFIDWVININNKIIDTIDDKLDKIELFFSAKKKEVAREVNDLLKK